MILLAPYSLSTARSAPDSELDRQGLVVTTIDMKIAELIARGEGPSVDFKRDLSSPHKVLKDIVAFANTSGGTVIVGVNDDRSIAGVDDPLKAEETLTNLIHSLIDPQLLPDIYVTTHTDKELLVVDVNHYPGPFWLKRMGSQRLTPETGTFVRLGSTSRAATPEILAELRRLAVGKPFDEEARPDVTLDDLDHDRLHAALDPRQVPVAEEKLESLGVLTEYQGRIVATNGGVILFSPNRLRRRLFADARVEGARFAGTTRAGDILDTFQGDELTVLEAVDEMERFIARNTRRAEPIPSGSMRRAPLPEYGTTMLRELLVNAIAHADYAAGGETIKVFIFDDRIEIYSPGLMLPGMTVDELKRGPRSATERSPPCSGKSCSWNASAPRGPRFRRTSLLATLSRRLTGAAPCSWPRCGPIPRSPLRQVRRHFAKVAK